MLKAFSDAVIKIAKKHKNLVLLNTDFSRDVPLMDQISLAFDDRCFNFGLQENNMVTAACGFAVRGKVPFCFGAPDLAVKAFPVISGMVCKNNLNVKIFGVEDCPKCKNLTVIEPKTYDEALEAVQKAFDEFGPFYIKLSVL
ncbi:hypothetical protein KJ632_05670 [Patescibacteria group bacterium]|nr:hypothetical protein [Patescibacteria group bacterium]